MHHITAGAVVGILLLAVFKEFAPLILFILGLLSILLVCFVIGLILSYWKHPKAKLDPWRIVQGFGSNGLWVYFVKFNYELPNNKLSEAIHIAEDYDGQFIGHIWINKKNEKNGQIEMPQAFRFISFENAQKFAKKVNTVY